MIVATDAFDMQKVKSLIKSGGDLCEYAMSLVPDRYKHVDGIYHNTRYFLNLNILKATDISLEDKTAASASLTAGLHVVGYMDDYITCGEMERHINMKKVNKYFEGDKYGKGG